MFGDPRAAFTTASAVTHLFLVHNLFPSTIFGINSAMWSVATEWQIYLAFPALLALWRRFGTAAAVAAGFAAGYAVVGVSRVTGNTALTDLCPWYLGLFALGMAGAVANFSVEPIDAARRERALWGRVAAGVWALLLAVFLVPVVRFEHAKVDPLVGLAAATLIVYCARHAVDPGPGRRPRVLAVLESAPAVWLGSFSYSLYLIHTPVLWLCDFEFRGLGWSAGPRLVTLLVAGGPLCLLTAYLFSLAFEKPFLSRRAKSA
jgi:peptidoglycan/LPS O-acetylase OafA/YrhL